MLVSIVGAGIVGITSAIHLQENGFDVTIIAKDDPLQLMDVNFYRPYLLKRFLKNGGSIIRNEVHAMTDLVDEFDVIVNCTGWEARKLTADREINPARGQLEVFYLGEKFLQQPSMH